MRRGLRKLTITKSATEDKNQLAHGEIKAPNEVSSEKMMGTYERDHPKSATFSKKDLRQSNTRRTSALVTSIVENEPLNVIIEES